MRPTVLILFGATGDLVAKKIVPSLDHLFRKRKLPEDLRVVGVSRRPMTSEEFRRKIGAEGGFRNLFSFHQLQFESSEDYRALATSLDPATDRLAYLAVPPEHYPAILENLRTSGAIRRTADMAGDRILVEKPFGLDAAHAEAIEERLARLADESQIYRIDHYLAKDMLRNVLNFRFSNNLFEDNWNARDIESVHLRLWEDIGVEHRGAFYDRIGALRDVGQNHLLQMLAFVAMDRPRSFSAEDIRRERAAVLEKLVVPDTDEIRGQAHRAQYEGYRSILGVRPDSDTETYCRLRAFLDSPRWRGVPFTMEAGKRMPERRKDITIRFRPPYRNVIVFSLEPTEGITIRFWAKKVGLDEELEERTFDFVHRDPSVGGPGQPHHHQYVAEYEKLLLDGIRGDQTLFVSAAEVRAMWRFIDPVVESWQRNAVPLGRYPQGVLYSP